MKQASTFYHDDTAAPGMERIIPYAPPRDFPMGELPSGPGDPVVPGFLMFHAWDVARGRPSCRMTNCLGLPREQILWLSKDTQTGCLMIIGTLWH